MTPRELLEAVARMPLTPPARRALLAAARDGRRLALWIVQAHRWRQAQTDRTATSWLERLWRRFWS